MKGESYFNAGFSPSGNPTWKMLSVSDTRQ
jgi:hypothetical protein